LQNPFKDPDVWESPPKLDKRQSNQKINKVNSSITSNNKNHQIRNVPVSKKKIDANGKKTFLGDRYP